MASDPLILGEIDRGEKMRTTDRKDISILVVDDDQQLADVLYRSIEKFGFNSDVAFSGEEALSKVQETAYSIIISDLKMPEISGLELLEIVKKEDDDIIFIIITGYGSIEQAVEAMKKGAYDFITKPFNLHEIEAIINRAVEKIDLQKQLGLFKGLCLALGISVPFWLLIGVILSWLF